MKENLKWCCKGLTKINNSNNKTSDNDNASQLAAASTSSTSPNTEFINQDTPTPNDSNYDGVERLESRKCAKESQRS